MIKNNHFLLRDAILNENIQGIKKYLSLDPYVTRNISIITNDELLNDTIEFFGNDEAINLINAHFGAKFISSD